MAKIFGYRTALSNINGHFWRVQFFYLHALVMDEKRKDIFDSDEISKLDVLNDVGLDTTVVIWCFV